MFSVDNGDDLCLDIHKDAAKEIKEAVGKVHKMTDTPYWYTAVQSNISEQSVTTGIWTKRQVCGALLESSQSMQLPKRHGPGR